MAIGNNIYVNNQCHAILIQTLFRILWFSTTQRVIHLVVIDYIMFRTGLYSQWWTIGTHTHTHPRRACNIYDTLPVILEFKFTKEYKQNIKLLVLLALVMIRVPHNWVILATTTNQTNKNTRNKLIIIIIIIILIIIVIQ